MKAMGDLGVSHGLFISAYCLADWVLKRLWILTIAFLFYEENNLRAPKHYYTLS
jgi:hypothetical protein